MPNFELIKDNKHLRELYMSNGKWLEFRSHADDLTAPARDPLHFLTHATVGHGEEKSTTPTNVLMQTDYFVDKNTMVKRD